MMAEDLFPEKDNAYRMAVDGIKVEDDNRTAVGQVQIILSFYFLSQNYEVFTPPPEKLSVTHVHFKLPTKQDKLLMRAVTITEIYLMKQ